MSDEKDPKSPATTSCAYDRMIHRWVMIETLLGGTEAMRAAGEAYAPKHAEETQEHYDDRIQGSVLFNMVEQTLDTLSGKPFTEPPKPGDDIPAAIVDQILEDVDLQGNNLDVFVRRWFREGMSKAFAHVLIDMPRPAEREDGAPRTLDDDRREGLRPYWVLVKPECVLFARSEIVDGVEVLKHVRILEHYTEQVGFAEVEKVRIRVLEPGLVQLWVPVEKKTSSQKEEWRLDDQWPTRLDYIPLVTFYADREGFMEGKPPLLDLAHLNITHWQSTSDQRHILTVARFPILACEGANEDDGDTVVIGPNKILYGPGNFKYIEHTGASIEAGRQDLKDLEEKMSGYGAEFLKKKPGGQTATARALDSAEATSDLSAMSVIFEDAVAQVLDITSEWMRLGVSGGTVEVVKEYDIQQVDPAEIEFLKYLREKNDLSRKTLLSIAMSKGLLPEDFDADADWTQIVDELTQRSELLGEALTDLDPAQEDEDEEEPGDADGE